MLELQIQVRAKVFFSDEAVTKFPYLLIRRQCRGNIELLHQEEKADGDTACGVNGGNADVEHQCVLNDSELLKL